jgi:signal transduction histidine kinase
MDDVEQVGPSESEVGDRRELADDPSATVSRQEGNAGDFGGLLRHELNNPLTGILGNAELLLRELRRNKIELPSHVQQRLEMIATLAVRMRETVRFLSEIWEAQKGDLTPRKSTNEN